MPEAEARQYAQEIGAVFKLTSASNGSGIEDMFRSIGCKYLNPNYKDENELKDASKEAQPSSGGNSSVRLDPKKTKEKKGCCK